MDVLEVYKHLSYDDFSRWKVPELQEYLRDRGLKTTGRKVKLVTLAYSANQMVVDTKRSSIEEKVKKKPTKYFDIAEYLSSAPHSSICDLKSA